VDRTLAVALATAAPPFSLIVSSGRRDPANDFARDELSNGREPQQRRRGRGLAVIGQPEGTEK
jgi:hypothetical protein